MKECVLASYRMASSLSDGGNTIHMPVSMDTLAVTVRRHQYSAAGILAAFLQRIRERSLAEKNLSRG